MKKLPALALACVLALLCACSAADPAQLAAARESGAAGTWYADTMGLIMVLNLNEDLSCAVEIDGASFSYRGTWKIVGSDLTMNLNAVSKTDSSVISMGELAFVYNGDTLTDVAASLVFQREQPASIEIAPVREDVTLGDFEGVWQAYMFDLNGFLLEVNGEPISPSEFGADMTVSIGTTSAAVDLGAYSDDSLSFMEFANAMTDPNGTQPPATPYNTTYIFPLELMGNELKMTLDPMEMTARLHTDGTMSISGRTPLHDTMFTTDAPLIVYLKNSEASEEDTSDDNGLPG